MTCTHCGNLLDAQDLELGACQRCGQPLGKQPAARQDERSPDDTSPGRVSESPDSWQDWPSSNQTLTGNTAPTQPKVAVQPDAASLAGTGPSDTAPTEAGLRSFVAPDAGFSAASAGINTPESSTAPFTIGPQPAEVPPTSIPPVQPQVAPAPPPFAAPTAAPEAGFPAQPTHRRQSKLLILGALAVVVLIALIGSGFLLARSFNRPSSSISAPPAGTPAPTATVTPTGPALRPYRDPNGYFLISYPASWQAMSFTLRLNGQPLPLNGVRFDDKESNASLMVVTGQALPFLPDQAGSADDAILQLLGASATSSAQDVRIGGQRWTEKRAETRNGKTVAASISYQGRLYSIIYSAPDDTFATTEAQVFLPMRATFMFGG